MVYDWRQLANTKLFYFGGCIDCSRSSKSYLCSHQSKKLWSIYASKAFDLHRPDSWVLDYFIRYTIRKLVRDSSPTEWVANSEGYNPIATHAVLRSLKNSLYVTVGMLGSLPIVPRTSTWWENLRGCGLFPQMHLAQFLWRVSGVMCAKKRRTAPICKYQFWYPPKKLVQIRVWQ